MKGGDCMIIISILALILILLGLFSVATIATVGAAGIILCGDVIVCIVFIGMLIRFLWNRKRK
jgi:Zn-dependent protease with chaperone function